MDRPAVIPEIAKNSSSLLCEFVATKEVVLNVIFEKFNTTAKMPFEIPSSMYAVENKKEDVPSDSESP